MHLSKIGLYTKKNGDELHLRTHELHLHKAWPLYRVGQKTRPSCILRNI